MPGINVSSFNSPTEELVPGTLYLLILKEDGVPYGIFEYAGDSFWKAYIRGEFKATDKYYSFWEVKA